jgi:predicted AAA+ superfamily ATPase
VIKKEVIKELIVGFQERYKRRMKLREVELPLNTKKVVVAKGVRRAGKSSAMLLVVDALLASGVPITRVLYLSFDDERLPFSAENFDLILQSYRELYPKTPFSEVHLFLDEVQQCPGWEQFVRRVYDQETKHIFITGSNAKLLSAEIASSLRGRTLQFEYFPLSFTEFCSFNNIDTQKDSPEAKARLVVAFQDYLVQGGFPELVVQSPAYRDKILQEYYHLMLYRDMVERYDIRNLPALRYFIRRLLVNITKPTSIHKIYHELKSAGLSVSKNSLYEWADQLETIYLFLTLPKYEPSMVKEHSSEKKYYLIDNGLLRALSAQLTEGKGKLLENLIFLHLRSQSSLGTQLFYFKGKKECDFMVTHNQEVSHLVQASWQLADGSTRERELAGLVEAAKATGCRSLWLVTHEEEETIDYDGYTIEVVPAWRFCLTFKLAAQSTIS